MQVTDPVCGMKLESTKAAASEVVQGGTLFFCSAACHGKYQANPARYARQAEPQGKGHGARGC